LIRALAGGEEAARLGEAARSAHLSPERFRHLFVEQTGMRFRPYVLWLRLERALEAYAAGASLTDAAQAGGFADSAHLSRTFRRMFGVAPASLTIE
jgi:AraC-like DNA-binding protein